jgi:hypothetical protein
LEKLQLLLVQVSGSFASPQALFSHSLVTTGFADSAVGQISSAIGSATIKAVDTAFTAGEAAVESAKKTTLGKVGLRISRFLSRY